MRTSFRQMIFLAVVLCCLSATILVAETDWQKLNGPAGCRITDLAGVANDPSVWFATVNGEGVFKSTNTGESWICLSIGIDELIDAEAIAINPVDPNTIYVGTWVHGIFKSDDGGANWVKLTNGLPVHTGWEFAIDPVDPDVVYVATEEAIFKSLDGGLTWTAKSLGINYRYVHSLTIDPGDHNTLYAGTIWGSTNYFYKSTDGAESWVICDLYLDGSSYVNAILVSPMHPELVYVGTETGIYRSIDGGLTWFADNVGLMNLHVIDLVFDPEDPALIFAATWGGLYYSTNFGDSWDFWSGDFQSQLIKALGFTRPGETSVLCVGAWDGVYRSLDRGESWTQYTEGLVGDAVIAQNVLAVDPGDSQILYAGTYGGGMFKSYDAGNAWMPINQGFSIAWMNGRCLAVSSDTLYVGVDGGGVYCSVDSGLTWQQKHSGVPVLEVLNLRYDPIKHEVMYLATGEGAFRSPDAAATWNDISNGLASINVKDFAVDPTDGSIVYVATDGGGVYGSLDSGFTWVSRSFGLPASLRTFRLAIDYANPNTLYVGTVQDGMYKTVNSGLTWVEINNGIDLSGAGAWDDAVSDIVVSPRNPRTVYIGLRSGGIYRTVDGGQNWETWDEGLTSPVINAVCVDPADPAVVYAGTGHGVFRREGCCSEHVGDVNGSGEDAPTIGDISVLIDAKFITGNCGETHVPPLLLIPCYAEADINQSGEQSPDCDDITIGDVSMLIDYLFITGPTDFGPLPDCY